MSWSHDRNDTELDVAKDADHYSFIYGGVIQTYIAASKIASFIDAKSKKGIMEDS